jgi:putative ABC transport system permease protein
MTGAVLLVLLIAIANVANLMLARATVREKEMAVRLSLGAGRERLVRQLLTESALLAVAGGVGGLALAAGGMQLIRAWNPGNLPFAANIHLDAWTFAFTLLLSLASGIVFGLAPALQSSRGEISAALRRTGRAVGGTSRGGMRSALVVGEIALSLVLVVGASLLLVSLQRLDRATGGFSAPPRDVVIMQLSLSGPKYQDDAVLAGFYDRALERIRNLPGVEFAAVSDSLPPSTQADADVFVIRGQVLAPGEMNPAISVPIVSRSYFEAMGIPLRRGRFFAESDTAASAPVVVVSESFARNFFPGQNPLGQYIQHSGGGTGPFMQVVGVAGDATYVGLEHGTDPAYYRLYRPNPVRRMYLVVRSRLGVPGIGPALRREVNALDADVTLGKIASMQEVTDSDRARPRFNTLLLSLFAGIALVLAAVGIYGVVAWSVAQRTHEIGVRMALGAGARTVELMVIGQGARLSAIGIAMGIAGALALTRLMSSLLFGIGATDPATFVTVAVGLFTIALLATAIPARRVTRVSPLTSLRLE